MGVERMEEPASPCYIPSPSLPSDRISDCLLRLSQDCISDCVTFFLRLSPDCISDSVTSYWDRVPGLWLALRD